MKKGNEIFIKPEIGMIMIPQRENILHFTTHSAISQFFYSCKKNSLNILPFIDQRWDSK